MFGSSNEVETMSEWTPREEKSGFRTRFTPVLRSVPDMLEERVTRPGERERIELVHRTSLSLLKPVNTLLDFARIEAGRVQPSFEPTDLTALTTDLASEFRSAIERAGLELAIDCAQFGEPIDWTRHVGEHRPEPAVERVQVPPCRDASPCRSARATVASR